MLLVPFTLVLLRHGQSEWNLKNLFTGWVDVDLTDQGRDEARRGGRDLAAREVRPDVVHTSVQVRAIRTAELALDECERKWIPVRRSWRLNERHYGDLQGKDKRETTAQFGAATGEGVASLVRRTAARSRSRRSRRTRKRWGYDERYAALPRDLLPRAECLKDVLERMLPWWYDAIVPDLRTGATVLVAAHGNSLRALVKHLDGLTAEEVIEFNLPTGEPLVYELNDDLRPARRKGPGGVKGRFLDPKRALAAAAAVAKQAG